MLCPLSTLCPCGCSARSARQRQNACGLHSGELARLSLALSVIASQAARVPTLIFDEVDSGIGEHGKHMHDIAQ